MLQAEHGSIAVTGVLLLGVVALTGMALTEKAWVDHHLALARRTADFAAEAAARYHERWAKIQVTLWKVEPYQVQDCSTTYDPDGNPVTNCTWVTRYRNLWSYPVLDNKERELEQHWRDLAGCGQNRDPLAGWVCVGMPQVLERRVEFQPEAEGVGEETFRWNWGRRGGARAAEVYVVPNASTKQVSVVARVELKPLFHLLGTGTLWRWVEGRGSVAMPPLQFF